jgi:hypothetical protein
VSDNEVQQADKMKLHSINTTTKSQSGGPSEKRQTKLWPLKWRRPLMAISIIVALVSSQQALALSSDQLEPDQQQHQQPQAQHHDQVVPANHRTEPAQAGQDDGSAAKTSTGARHGRQYDGPLSASGTGDASAYVTSSGAYPSLAAGYNSASASTGGLSAYAGDPLGSGVYSSAANHAAYHDQMSLAARAAGYPSMHTAGYPSAAAPPPPPPPSPGSFASPLAAMFPSAPGSGLFSSSGGFPLMAKGFDLAEIVCTAIAVAIGAVIVGAPFILLYLFVMNQMQGSGPNAMGPSGGAISLTGPTSSTTVTGRRKRHTNLSDALFKQLSPLVNSEQVAQTFKALMSALAKYQV